MEVVPWPLSVISTQTTTAALGEAASRPHTETERALQRKLLEHRQHEPGYVPTLLNASLCLATHLLPVTV
jgi:hypothetical protein